MRARRRTFHIVVGLATLIMFIGSGAYMRAHLSDILAAREAIRYQFRANHIYLLMSGLINLAIGLHPAPIYNGWRTVVGGICSVLLACAPILLLLAFLIEPAHGDADRPLTFFDVLMLLLGTLATYLPYLPSQRSR